MSYFLPVCLMLTLVTFILGRSRALSLVDGQIVNLHSKPSFHGAFLAILSVLPVVGLFILYMLVHGYIQSFAIQSYAAEFVSASDFSRSESFYRSVNRAIDQGLASASDTQIAEVAARVLRLMQTVQGAVIIVAIAVFVVGFMLGLRRIHPALRARQVVERAIMILLFSCSGLAVLTTVGIVLSLIFEAFEFFSRVSFIDFLFGTHWAPQNAFEGAGVEISAAEEAARNARIFGALPVFAGTLLITFIAMIVAVPVGLFAAVYLSDYATKSFRAIAKPLLEILAGVPTVVYGFFAALTVAPFLRNDIGATLGLSISSESALAAGLVMGIMIIPFVSSLSDDVINSVPQSLRDGSAGLGATKAETIKKVVLPAALPGIVSAVMLAISRAIGETMIVVMAAGIAVRGVDNFIEHFNPLEAVTTVTVQIVTLLTGDSEFNSAKTLSVFALGLMLFIITLLLNIIALRVIQKYRDAYD